VTVANTPDDPYWGWEFRCEDFVYARLAEQQTTAEQLPAGADRDQALLHVDTLYLIATDHNIWVDARGQSAGRCITCRPSDSGVPCHTMRGLARLWRTHPDYITDWNAHIEGPHRSDSATYQEYKKRTTIWRQREAELTAFYGRFDLEQVDGGERWRCKTCGEHGETWKTTPGAYDYPHAIGTAADRHPTCERTTP
jgi:hypothetical protein